MEKNKSNANIRVACIVLGSTISFQFYRLLYSRLLGLEIFFARFSSPLILKPISYLTIAYFFVTSLSLIALSALSILRQNVVHTSLFYSSVEIICL